MSRPVTGGTLCFPGRPSFRPSFRLSFRLSFFRGTNLRAAPSKNYAFSTSYHAWIAMPTWPRCAPPILCWPWPPYSLLPRSFLTWIFFVDPHWWVPLCLQRPAKAMPFQQIIMLALHYQHHVDVHLLFCFDLDLPIASAEVVFNLDFLRRSSLMGTTLRAVPSKSHAFSTNYHTCIAMPTWHRCAPPTVFHVSFTGIIFSEFNEFPENR